MDQIETWRVVITSSFQNLWMKVIAFLPNLLSALVVFILGVFIARLFSRFITRTLKYLYLDKATDNLGIKEAMEKVGIKLNLSKIVGLIIKWFFIIVFLMAAADILQLTQITDFLNRVIFFIPNVIISVVILMLGIIFSNFIYKMVKASVYTAKLGADELIASVAKWAILIFTIMIVLVQLGIAPALINALFQGLMAMIAIAGGIAFGLGGRDKAKEIIDKLGKSK